MKLKPPFIYAYLFLFYAYFYAFIIPRPFVLGHYQRLEKEKIPFTFPALEVRTIPDTDPRKWLHGSKARSSAWVPFALCLSCTRLHGSKEHSSVLVPLCPLPFLHVASRQQGT